MCNQKFQGDITCFETVLTHFGLTTIGHGTHHKHIFRILKVAGGSAISEVIPASTNTGNTLNTQ
ncbi:MAG TPA: hypothetical protein VF411_09155 [Bacteroidia bacterium]